MMRTLPGATGIDASDTVNGTPPTVTVPVCAVVLLLAENVTVVDPAPDAALVMVSHGADVVADHVQLALVVTVKLPVPPASGSVCAVGDSVYVQASAA